MPEAVNNEDNFLLYTDSARLAKRYKTFTPATSNTPLPGPHESAQTEPPENKHVSKPDVTPPMEVSDLDIAFPLLKQGDACSVPYEEHIEPLGQKKVTIFHGTLLNRTTNEAGQEGFLVKFNGYPEPEFVDGLSLMECRL